MKRIFSKNKESPASTSSSTNPTKVYSESTGNYSPEKKSSSPVTPVTPISFAKNYNNNNNNKVGSDSDFDPLMPPTITNKKRSNSFTNLLRAMSPSSNSMMDSSPTRAPNANQLSNANLMTKALSPELVPVVTLLSAQAHRRYHVGVFLLFHDLNNDGQPATRVWKEQYAVLIGTQLALWNASDLQISKDQKYTTTQMTEKLFAAASKPKYINFTDANFKVLIDKDNTLVVSTTMKNRYFLKFSDAKSFQMWHSAFRLCTFEYSSLQEAYTGAFLSAKGAKLSDIKVILADTKFKYEDWVSVRFGAGMPWKRCYAVVSQPTKKSKKSKSSSKKSSSNSKTSMLDEFDNQDYMSGEYGEVTFYENEKKINNKKYAMARIHSAFSVFAIYPSSPLLIDDSTMLKIEGMVTFGKNDKDAKESDIFIMPEKHFAVPGYDTIIRFLVPMLNAFQLYGRPERLISTKDDPQSLLFGLPTLPEIHYLQVEDLLELLKKPNSSKWNNKVWKRQIQQLLLSKLKKGYLGCGSASGYSGALISPSITSVELFKKSASPQIQPISRFVSEGIPVSHSGNGTSQNFHQQASSLKTPVNQTIPVNLTNSAKSGNLKPSVSPVRKEVVGNSFGQRANASYANTPLKAASKQHVREQQKHEEPPLKLDIQNNGFGSPKRSTRQDIQSPPSPYQQYKYTSEASPYDAKIQEAPYPSETMPVSRKIENSIPSTFVAHHEGQVTNGIQGLDIGRESEKSNDSIPVNGKQDGTAGKMVNNHTSVTSEFLQQAILDSYIESSGSSSENKNGPNNSEEEEQNGNDDEDYVIGGESKKENGEKSESVDPLADFYKLSRTLSTYKPLNSQTAKKLSQDADTFPTSRPILPNKNSSTALEDFHDARDSFEFGESGATDGVNNNPSSDNVFDPDYYETNSILEDSSVNAVFDDPSDILPSRNRNPEVHMSKSPNMKNVAVPVFATENGQVRKSPKINNFKNQMNGPKPAFQQPIYQQQVPSPNHTGSPQFPNNSSPSQPNFQINQQAGPHNGYANPYQHQNQQQLQSPLSHKAPQFQQQYPHGNTHPMSPQQQYHPIQPQQQQQQQLPYMAAPVRPQPPRTMSGGRMGQPPYQQQQMYHAPQQMAPVQAPRQMSMPQIQYPQQGKKQVKKPHAGGFSQFMPTTQAKNPYSN